MTEKDIVMITEPLSINNGVAPQNWRRLSVSGTGSDWFNSTTDTVSDRGTLKLSSQKFGKNGSSVRRLVQFTKRVTVDGVSELATMNLTLTMPSNRAILTDAGLDQLRASIYYLLFDYATANRFLVNGEV